MWGRNLLHMVRVRGSVSISSGNIWSSEAKPWPTSAGKTCLVGCSVWVCPSPPSGLWRVDGISPWLSDSYDSWCCVLHLGWYAPSRSLGAWADLRQTASPIKGNDNNNIEHFITQWCSYIVTHAGPFISFLKPYQSIQPVLSSLPSYVPIWVKRSNYSWTTQSVMTVIRTHFKAISNLWAVRLAQLVSYPCLFNSVDPGSSPDWSHTCGLVLLVPTWLQSFSLYKFSSMSKTEILLCVVQKKSWCDVSTRMLCGLYNSDSVLMRKSWIAEKGLPLLGVHPYP